MMGEKSKSEDGKKATKKPKSEKLNKSDWHQVGRGGGGPWRHDGGGKQMELSSWNVDSEQS